MPNSGQLPAEINLSFVEALFGDYLRDPASVSPDWRAYFDAIASESGGAQMHLLRTATASRSATVTERPPAAPGGGPRQTLPASVGLQHGVDKLVRAFRVRGHMVARVDPLELAIQTSPELDPEFHGLHPRDMDKPISPETLSGCSLDTPGQVIERLRETYTRSVGVQFMHIDDLGVRDWLQKRMESTGNRVQLSQARQTPHSHQADRRHDFRGLHPEEIHRRQELLSGGLRDADPR